MSPQIQPPALKVTLRPGFKDCACYSSTSKPLSLSSKQGWLGPDCSSPKLNLSFLQLCALEQGAQKRPLEGRNMSMFSPTSPLPKVGEFRWKCIF